MPGCRDGRRVNPLKTFGVLKDLPQLFRKQLGLIIGEVKMGESRDAFDIGPRQSGRHVGHVISPRWIGPRRTGIIDAAR